MQRHDIPGKVVLLGVPAEEADGGKIVIIRNGGYKQMDVSHEEYASSRDAKLFVDVKICLMAHPTPYSALAPMLAVSECTVEYFGRK